MTQALRVVVLAGQRPGRINALAARFGVSHKCLVPLAGRPLIAHVLATLAAHPRVESVMVCVEHEAAAAIARIAAGLPGGDRIVAIAARDNIADSVTAAAQGWPGRLIVTTADHALLTTASIDAMADALAHDDVAIGMAPRDAVLAAHPEGQRRFYEFRDDAYSNCNLYAMATPEALRAAEAFRGGGQFAKSAMRIVRAFGLVNLILLRLHAVSLATGLARIGRRFGLTIAPVVLRDGSQAIDVDNDRTYAIVDQLLARRAGESPARAPAPARRAAG